MKVLITPRSFGQHDPRPYDILKENGFKVLGNPLGRILTKDEMKELAVDVDAVILGVDPLDNEVIESAKKLKVISRYGVGLDNVDLKAASEKDIQVFRTAGANSDAVADYAFGLILAASRKIVYIDRECRKDNFKKIKTYEVWKKTIGIIGLGAIGKGIAKRAKGFNMRVLACDVYQDEGYAKANHIAYVDMDTIIKECDFISLHLPLTEATRNLFSYEEFEKMKDTAIIINTARGGVIDEEALYDALKKNKIAGAGIDVFEVEPPVNKAFYQLDNIVIGSHCAASSYEAIDNMSMGAVNNLLEGLLSLKDE